MLVKLVPLLLGLYFLYLGAGALALTAFGEPLEALVDSTAVKNVKEAPHEAGQIPTYVMRTKVRYHFDVCSPASPGAETVCSTATGSDTRITSTPYSVLPHEKGYSVQVVFLRFAPWVNALRQPRHLVVYGLLELAAGLAIAVWEILVFLRSRGGPVPAPRKAAAG